MSAPKVSNSSTNSKSLHYVCKCNPPRCTEDQKQWTIKMCKICEEQFECKEKPDGHECDQTLHYCKIRGCKFTSLYRRNLNRHVKQKHTTKVTQEQTTIDCEKCKTSSFHKGHKHKKCNCIINTAIQHSLPTHNWLEDKIKANII